MQNLIVNPDQLTMSSRDIAELVESRHDNVKTTIDRLAARGAIQLPAMQEVKNHLGQTVTEYRVNKRDSYVVVAQLSPEFTARLVDRWQELEQKARLGFDPNNEIEVLENLLITKKQLAHQAALIEQQKPAVEFVDNYVAASSGSKGFRQVAKLIQANEREFRNFLQAQGIMYRLGGEWMPYQNHIDAGRFEVKAGVAGEHAFNQSKFTAKGVKWVAGLWAQYKLEDSE